MNKEFREIITGLIIFGIVILLAWFLFGRDIEPDLSSNYSGSLEDQYYEGEGSGHPLWNN